MKIIVTSKNNCKMFKTLKNRFLTSVNFKSNEALRPLSSVALITKRELPADKMQLKAYFFSATLPRCLNYTTKLQNLGKLRNIRRKK